METRRYKKTEINKKKSTELLRRFDTKNFVKINQDLLNSIDNFQAGRSDVVVKNEPIDLFFSAPSSSTPTAEPVWDERTLRMKFPQRTARSTNSGYSLRCSRRVANKLSANNQDDENGEQSEFTTQIDVNAEPDDADFEEFNGSLNSAVTPTAFLPPSSSSPPPSSSRISSRRASMARNSASPAYSPATKRRKIGGPPFPKMSAIDFRAARYGWIMQDTNIIPIVHKGDPGYVFENPDDYVCFNDKKSWAATYTICVGQKNLCKWM